MLNTILEDPIEVITALISLISVLIALYGVQTGYRIANFQTRFQKKSDAYDQFVHAFATYVYMPSMQAKEALASALYTAALFAPPHVIRALNATVSVVFKENWRAPGGPAALDEIINKVIHILHDDIKREHLPPLVKKIMNKISAAKYSKQSDQ
ncbi:MAG TPA: hypothetical protein H9842_06935 [Candidatus Agathobaculum merdipullorum]|nr:hypothetical protein [Candidatus Agathobaculum merdipullorum]